MASNMNRNIMILLSVIIPIGIFGMLYHYLHDASDSPTELHPGIVGLDERFQNTQPDIIVVGSSVANKAIERSEFAKLMGVPPNKPANPLEW